MSRKKSVHPVSVLRSVDSASNSLTIAPADACQATGSEQVCEESVSESALASVRKQLTDLYASCSPANSTRVQEYLAQKEGPDAGLILAWSRYGRADRGRTVDLRLNEVARQTVSPLGYACLIAYARAWLDESEARLIAARALARRCCPPSGSAAKDQPQATSQPPLARVAVASKRRSRK